MKSIKIKKLVLSAMFISLGFVLPFLTGQIPQIGKMLLPMHIPVLLCGLVCGWQYGFAIGFVLPLLRSLIFSQPLFYPDAIAMAFELAAYGFFVGLVYSRSKWQCLRSLYRAMLCAMVGGRLVWGLVKMILLGVGTNGFTLSMFLSGAVLMAIPGILVQLVLIPMIMLALDKTHLVPFKKEAKGEIYAQK